jgi:hypothetical protein
MRCWSTVLVAAATTTTTTGSCHDLQSRRGGLAAAIGLCLFCSQQQQAGLLSCLLLGWLESFPISTSRGLPAVGYVADAKSPRRRRAVLLLFATTSKGPQARPPSKLFATRDCQNSHACRVDRSHICSARRYQPIRFLLLNLSAVRVAA